MNRIEKCYLCNEPTGRAGACEDSIFIDLPNMCLGPLCESCQHGLEEWCIENMCADTKLDAAKKENERLSTDLGELKDANQTGATELLEARADLATTTERAEKAEAETKIWKQAFREIVSRDECSFLTCEILRCGSGECMERNYDEAKKVIEKMEKKGAPDGLYGRPWSIQKNEDESASICDDQGNVLEIYESWMIAGRIVSAVNEQFEREKGATDDHN